MGGIATMVEVPASEVHSAPLFQLRIDERIIADVRFEQRSGWKRALACKRNSGETLYFFAKCTEQAIHS